MLKKLGRPNYTEVHTHNYVCMLANLWRAYVCISLGMGICMQVCVYACLCIYAKVSMLYDNNQKLHI